MSRLIDNTYVEKSPIHGYGVFAKEDIAKGEVIMECVIPMELLTKNTFAMRSYRFAWRSEDDNRYEDDFVPLGNSGLINYPNDRNIKGNVKWTLDKKERLFTAYAIRDIEGEDEILLDYNSDVQYKIDPIT